MFGWFDKIIETIRDLNSKVEHYREDTVIQSLPSVAYVNRAKKMMEEFRYKEALEILKQAESLPQQDALVYKYQGIIYDKLYRFEDAVKAYKISANLDCNDKIIWKNLGFSLLNVKLYDESEECFENADKITPANSEVLMGWGMALMKQDKCSEARDKFVLSAKVNKYNSNAIFLAAVMEINLKMYDEAEQKLNFLSRVAPNEGNSYEYAKLKYINKDYDSAEFYAKKALIFNKNMLPVYLLLGKIYRFRGEEDKAMEVYEQAEHLSLIAGTLYVEWAVTLIRFERYDIAFEKLTKAGEIDGKTPEIEMLRAFCWAASGKVDYNREIFEKALQENIYRALTLRALGIIACADGDFVQGITNFKLAMKDDPSDKINYYYIAKAYQHKGDNSNTKEYFEVSIKENPKHLRSYVDYARFLISIDDYAEANRKLRKALKQYENNLTILNMLFYVNYILVKDNVCEYNIKEVLEFERQIKLIEENAFKYPDKSAELTEMLKDLQEKDIN